MCVCALYILYIYYIVGVSISFSFGFDTLRFLGDDWIDSAILPVTKDIQRPCGYHVESHACRYLHQLPGTRFGYKSNPLTHEILE